ncbi:MAG: family 43 glycosylhydrolase [Planctomycetota bacterium]
MTFVFIALLSFAMQSTAPATNPGTARVADKPLFEDPVFDGAADPSIIWNRETETWFMFYTNRRANMEEPDGVEWVHGTRIGIAESADGGATWEYVGEANIDLADGGPQTHWAPAVVHRQGRYHMFLTHVPGIFTNWKHSRSIVHLTSENLRDWTFHSTLDLDSTRVIDAGVFPLADGTWRLWYKDEMQKAATFYADSRDLETWQVVGRATEGPPSEAPVVFRWKDRYWLIVDEWSGLGVYHSDDAATWTRQEGPRLLSQPGTGPQDKVKGSHPDVLVSDDRAYLFYFTHPGRRGGVGFVSPAQRRSVMHVTELSLEDGRLTTDRNAPTYIDLKPGESPGR